MQLRTTLALLAAAALLAGCGDATRTGSAGPVRGATVPGDGADPIEAAAKAGRSGGGIVVEPEVGRPEMIRIAGATDAVPRDPEEALAKVPDGAHISPGAPSDDEVRAELKQLTGGKFARAYVTPDGRAVAPLSAPAVVKQIIAAGNVIATTPYIWGGGHGRLYDRGYDCSGSVSFALINAGLLDTPRASGFGVRGREGPGKWVSIYSNSGHVWMVVAGLRFDTSALHLNGSRWTTEARSLAGFTVRHPPGL
jgi:cell wall-associated NlpC family hydrolase